MNREEVRTFIKDGVDALVPAIEFGSGLITDFNSLRSHQYPSVWLNLNYPVPGTNPPSGAPVDEWKIELIIAQKDAFDSSPGTYEGILDACDLIAQKLSYLYNAVITGYKLVTISSRDREPFVKKYADCLTGVILTFTLTSTDQTDVCP